MTHKLNRLAQAQSPYLIQHANNPVDWYVWGEEALQRAREENKPILLSIGYAACHWCHVMAHESFEDEDIANFMNQYFINIKVDREERPDLDKIYQSAHQLLNQRGGGWPLTVFLTPSSHIPFFSGTYFPKQPRYGMPTFMQVLKHVQTIFQTHREAINQQNQQLLHILKHLNQPANLSNSLGHAPIIEARQQLEAMFDATHGGYGEAPKFPQPMLLDFLLGEKNVPPTHSLYFSLKKMAEGGIYDQIGGGFFRYSVDAAWEIPHFEKMLYDNGQLLSVYANAYQKTRYPLFKKVLIETAEWVLREMRSEEGGFFSSLNADSEGEEGKYYRWRKAEIKEALTQSEFSLISRYFNLETSANFEGYWHLQIRADSAALENILKRPVAEIEKVRTNAIKKLFAQRMKRIAPSRDDKILTAWNALMIKGLAKAGFVLGREDFIEAACRAIEFLRTKLWVNHCLSASYKNGYAYLRGYLDDYAFLLDASLSVLQVRWQDEIFVFAQALADRLLEDYYDTSTGGFFFTASQHEKLLLRLKPLMDESIPSGNAIAARALQHLGTLTGNTKYREASEKTVRFAYDAVKERPVAHASFLLLLQEYLLPPTHIMLRGDQNQLDSWRDVFLQHGAEQALFFAIPNTARYFPIRIQADEIKENRVTAYVCHGFSCSKPIKTLQEFRMHLKKSFDKTTL
jgi:uncharacterized protein YyaL (SSP411 family)